MSNEYSDPCKLGLKKASSAALYRILFSLRREMWVLFCFWASESHTNNLWHGCTIDFTFTRPNLKIVCESSNLCATRLCQADSSSSLCKLLRLFPRQDLAPFIRWTAGQSVCWQPCDSIQMEIRRKSGSVC